MQMHVQQFTSFSLYVTCDNFSLMNIYGLQSYFTLTHQHAVYHREYVLYSLKFVGLFVSW